jgi:hypothetical protein
MNSNAAPESVPARYGRVTLEQQARWAPLAFERIQQEWPWAGVTAVWFFKKASDAGQDDPSYYFRLVDPDFTPLPVYDALSVYLNSLEPVVYPGRHQESTWQLEYRGPWRRVTADAAALGAYVRTSSPGAEVRIAWVGRSLHLVPGAGSGMLQVADEQSATQQIALNGQPVRLGGSLLKQRHTYTLTVLEGEVSIDEIVVK